VIPPSLYPRTLTPAGRRAYLTAIALDRSGDWRVTWGSQTKAFKTEQGARDFAHINLRVVRGVTDAEVTGPHQHTIEVQP
jgi:hypothetical protein